MGTHSCETEALLLVLPSTDYQQRVPVAIGTTITDMAVEYIGKLNLKIFLNPGRLCVVPHSLRGWYWYHSGTGTARKQIFG